MKKVKQRKGNGEFYRKLSENPSSLLKDSIAIDLGDSTPSNSTSVYSSGPSTYRQSPYYSGTSSAYPPSPSQQSSTSQTKTRRRPQSPVTTPSSQPSSGGYATPAPRVLTETTPTIASSAPRPTTIHPTASVSLPPPPIAPIAAPAGDDDIFGLAYLLILHQCATELKTQLEGESFWWFRGDRAEADRRAILAKTTAFTNYRTLTGIHGDTALTMTQKQTIQNATVALLALVKKIKISRNYLFFLSSFRPALPHFISVYDGYLEDKLKHRTQEIKRLVTEKQTLTNQIMELKPKDETESPIYLHGQIDVLVNQVREKEREVEVRTDALKNISAIVEFGEHTKKLDNIAATLSSLGITSRSAIPRRQSSPSSTSKEEKTHHRDNEKGKELDPFPSNSSSYR